jgi:transcription elongation factor Elf1
MEEVEKFFKCPSCFEKISMLLDISVDGQQSYVEDCEVCCHPIQIEYSVQNERIVFFEYNKAYD